ncbi:heme exporter protein B [Rubricella aquisinus]|uniref:Heme exporter protein B n=1 Tax=Rubricella aquisinus TaxID=2028108 RepID=A0A840WYK5_9RHOB|nr:heme exporter protein CcmB [Rubricella aquisinus]MBB5516230.1 heme exporter protein B [Rubricella aquisinus]
MNAYSALLRRELTLALRSGGGAGLGLAFFLIVIMLIPFGVGPETPTLGLIAPGVLWVAALLACLLSLDRLFQQDAEDGTLDILALSPVPMEGLVMVKTLGHWLTTGVPLVIAAPVLGLTLNLAGPAYPWLVAALLVGTPALSALGAIGAALTVGVRRGGLLLSILVLPLYIPTLIFGAQVVSLAAKGLDPGIAMMLLTGTSLFAVAVSPFASAAALRVHLS